MAPRDKDVYFAKLAEQAERYDEMAEHMKNVGAEGSELSVEERNLLSVAYKNTVGSRRAAWRIISSVMQKETSKGNADNAAFAKEYCAKVEDELQGICDTILGLLDGTLIPKASGGESKVFYQKMKADYYRYIAEFRDGDAKSKAAENARKAYADAAAVAETSPSSATNQSGLSGFGGYRWYPTLWRRQQLQPPGDVAGEQVLRYALYALEGKGWRVGMGGEGGEGP